MRLRCLTVSSAALALALATPAAPALAHEGDDVDNVAVKTVLAPGTSGAGDNMVPVANLPYTKTGSTSQAGSDIELARIGGRDYAFAGTLRNGLQIIDVTDPSRRAPSAAWRARSCVGRRSSPAILGLLWRCPQLRQASPSVQRCRRRRCRGRGGRGHRPPGRRSSPT